MQFLHVTNFDGRKLSLNPDHIQSLISARLKDEGNVIIRIIGDAYETTYHVLETFDEVIKKLELI